jgi:hypothetical protein
VDEVRVVLMTADAKLFSRRGTVLEDDIEEILFTVSIRS